MIEPSFVSAVLVTRGNVPLDEILLSIDAAGITDVVVWDNSKREDLGCYGRYAGIAEAQNEYIYVQDDDLIAPVDEILDNYDRDHSYRAILANTEPDEVWHFVGRGAIFHRHLLDDCFEPYTERYGDGPAFRRVSDIVFAYSNPYNRVFFGWRDLPWATDANRMYNQPRHYEVREQARDRVRRLHGDEARLREPQ